MSGTGENGGKSGAKAPLLRALRGERLARPPVWLMRQAGRYLPEYRALRAKAGSFLDLCYTPDHAVEVTLQPIRRFGFDAAILFSDILVVPHALGQKVWFVEGEGPKLEPIRDAEGLRRLGMDGFHAHLEPVYETVSRLRAQLPPEVALIGFAGAPWTLAAYMTEGAGSKEYQVARTLGRRDPKLFDAMIGLLTDSIIDYLDRQVQAGADVVQLFDSWAGVLPPDQFRRWCVEPMARIVAGLRERHPGVPVIAFPRGAGLNYPAYAARVPGLAGIGIDTSVDPTLAAKAFADRPDLCLQGNLDPIALLAGGRALESGIDSVLSAWRERPFIFNLGHGVLPQTPPENVAFLVDRLKSMDK